MNGLFDKEISIYRNQTDTLGAVVTLRRFLFSEKHRREIEYLRSVEDTEERKRLKSLLPMATISGLFSYRNQQHLIKHSGLICIDIDAKDNPTMDAEQTKQQLAEFQEMAYIGLSVGGKGLFCIMPIAYPDKHKEHFYALKSDFKGMGIAIDDNCKDITRPRTISLDPFPHINENAKEYIYTQQKLQPPIKHYSYDDSEETVRKVYDLCRQIQDCGLDITEGYQNWLKVGSSLASLGEDGREACHMVSRAWPKYDTADADKKFDNLLQTIRDYSIGTFFYICKDYGLMS
jgi:hypothetical protein